MTKRFKDDMPPLAPKKKKVNPNSPTDEDIEPTQMSESSHDSETKNFVTKLKLKKRTLDQMCEKIQKEDGECNEKLEEINSSDQQGPEKDSGSEDDPLLLKLQGNILGVLNIEKPDIKVPKPMIVPIKEEKKISSNMGSSKKSKELITTKSLEKAVSQTAKKDKSNGSKKMQISI
jgi:hypothetical protein